MSKQDSNTRKVNLTQAERLIGAAFRNKRPVMLWGPPGIGKSEVVEQVARSGQFGEKVKVIDFRLPLMEPTDIRGIPFPQPGEHGDTEMIWAVPSEFPKEPNASKYDTIVLFLDEFNGAPQSVQAAAYQLLLNRRIGEYYVPDNVVMICAGNRDGDGGVTFKMPTPVKNRLVHLEIAVSFNSWLDWALMNKVHPTVVGYLNFQNGSLNKFDAKNPQNAFATPRSWTFVSQFCFDRQIADDDLTELVCGTVGEGVGLEFMSHRALAEGLPNPMDILEGKVKKLDNKELSALYALGTSMCHALDEASREVAPKDNDKFHKYVDNFLKFMMDNFKQVELVVMCARTALHNYKLPVVPTKLNNFKEFHARYSKYIQKAMN